MNKSRAILCGLLAAGLTSLSPSSLAASANVLATYGERVGMVFLDRRCDLLEPEQKLAVVAFAAQARGEMLRRGASTAALDQARDAALVGAGRLDCASTEVQAEAARLRKAFGGWRGVMVMELPATQRSWTLNRAGLDDWRVWQVLEGVDREPDHIRAGLIRHSDGSIRFAVELANPDVSAVRVHLRDRSLLPLADRAQGLTPPPRAATIQLNGAEKSPAIMVARSGVEARGGSLMVFGLADSRQIVRADPRDAFEIEIAARDGTTASHVLEVGDLVVGYAFAALS